MTSGYGYCNSVKNRHVYMSTRPTVPTVANTVAIRNILNVEELNIRRKQYENSKEKYPRVNPY